MSGYKTHTESALLLQIKEGNYIAYQELYDRHFDTVFGCAYNILRDQQDAEDIVQDIFLWFWEHREQWNLSSCKGYLLTAVKFKTASYFRANKVKSDFYKRMEVRGPEQINENVLLEVRQLHAIIEQITSDLPERCRAIFSLSRFEQLSNKEIAAKLEISEKTVEAQITIALRKLKAKLGKSHFLLYLFV